jgi:thioredoxin reductase
MTGNRRLKFLFTLTGSDVPAHEAQRQVRSMDASMPGAFAVGDIRYGAVKRVASGVGEGAASIGQVHDFLDPEGSSATSNSCHDTPEHLTLQPG